MRLCFAKKTDCFEKEKDFDDEKQGVKLLRNSKLFIKVCRLWKGMVISMIQVKELSKNYYVTKKEKGFTGAVKNLVKSEKKTVEAVKDISFQIEDGEIVAFLGPNGAGKSTTIKMLSGIMTPTSGEIFINGTFFTILCGDGI